MRALKIYLLGIGTMLLLVAGLAALDVGYLHLTGKRQILPETAAQRLSRARHEFDAALQQGDEPGTAVDQDQWSLVEPAGVKNTLGLYHFTWINCDRHLEVDVMLQYDPCFLVKASPVLPLAEGPSGTAACA